MNGARNGFPCQHVEDRNFKARPPAAFRQIVYADGGLALRDQEESFPGRIDKKHSHGRSPFPDLYTGPDAIVSFRTSVIIVR